MKCEDDIDECKEGEYPCADNDNTECVNSFGSHECICKVGWKGTNCTEERLYCEETPCKNGGECTEDHSNENGFVCSCLGTGFQGPICDNDILMCDNSPCANGQCEELPGSYTCNCAGTGYYGNFCEITCLNSRGFCLNGGTCENLGVFYNGTIITKCKCLPDFEGDLCETLKSTENRNKKTGNWSVILAVLLPTLLLVSVVMLVLMGRKRKSCRTLFPLFNRNTSGEVNELYDVPRLDYDYTGANYVGVVVSTPPNNLSSPANSADRKNGGNQNETELTGNQTMQSIENGRANTDTLYANENLEYADPESCYIETGNFYDDLKDSPRSCLIL